LILELIAEKHRVVEEVEDLLEEVEEAVALVEVEEAEALVEVEEVVVQVEVVAQQ
jgi:hypothetical protein